ncbi:DUF1697 domain-containing protein [Paenibacillus sp. 481]|uniref:DUF1697 domain-containing protein n=1 Tax=Paenibacillus sp. 481 TaxID=2835869 RepID=UPI001E44EE02|nr:DUF1697 domain-containing protein [Paenibacillus sp. 481]UHA73215.1 DUF1697 domain-containing protein [Paenibacillus sp. 481]
MLYVALLRGINVGGKNKIDMKLLKTAFEEAGMENVVTYIHTGNIIFTTDEHSKMQLSHMLEEAIQTNFGLSIKVVIRSDEEFTQMMSSLPASWSNDQQMKSDVLFLWDEIDDESVLDRLVINPEVDTVKYVSGAILWSVDRNHVTKSGMMKLMGTKIYQQVTIRNVNTTRKIVELLQAGREG